MSDKALFIAATGQNVGKTTLCLGILAALKKRYNSVGFIKPVGQRHEIVNGTSVDKDVILFKEHFELSSSWQSMSPVIIPNGFTRKYLNGEVSEKSLLNAIKASYKEISAQHSYTLVEGTGHVGVGSIVDMNNARVAAELGLDMVIIAPGGLGSTHDELAMNIALCHQYGVKIRGIILNRVIQDKYQMIKEYFPKSLEKWGIPLVGCVPYCPLLSQPTIKDFENLFKTELICGDEHRIRHFTHARLVAGSVETYRDDMVPNELIITPASREDIIDMTMKKHHESLEAGHDYGGGMILTGRRAPSEELLEKIRTVNMPILYAPMTSYDAMKKITSFIAKIRIEDKQKIQEAIELVEKHVNFEEFLAPLSSVDMT
ncbi:MAG: AAA family ATPase [Chlamydiales bacterium]|nr:AAA family ATPase [Chlamydiia bacterium]MCP5508473.1 AAA family ATPase [Chlamydiales bacterium]